MNARMLLLIALGAAVGGGIWLLSQDPAPGPHPGPGRGGDGADVVTAEREPFFAAAECRDCHRALYAEWEQSYHGMAWTDPMVQALSEGFRKPECIDCHAPQPIHMTGVDQRVAPRQHARADGVDCLSCHLLDDGVSVAATRTVDTSATPGACRPVAVPTMAVSTVCAGCHNQHETVDELLASGVQAECQTCHMPDVERAAVGDRPARAGRSHVFPGAHDEAMHKRAVKLEVRVDDGRVIADVTNVGAGHKVPTDARHRSYNVWVDAWDTRGNPWVTDEHVTEFRLYYRDDFKPTTQLEHAKPRSGEWTIPEGFRGKVRVRLTYALNPEELATREIFAVHEQEVWIR